MTPVTEAQFQDQVVELAGIYGWRVLHVRRSIGRRNGTAGWQTTTSIRGWPDLFCWHPDRGVCFAAELKSAAGKVTADQQQVLDQLAASGITTYIWRPDDFDTVVTVLARSTCEPIDARPGRNPSVYRVRVGTPSRSEHTE